MKLPREQFQQLAMEQLDMLYRLARRLTGDANKCEDLVQETYLRALRACEGFDLQKFGMAPWLVRIMHNLHITRQGQEHRQPKSMDTDHLEASAGDGAADSAAMLPPIDPGSFDAMDERLVEELELLPRDYQSVLLLWAVEDFSYQEIAAALDIPIGTVMSRLYRARQRLSDRLKKTSGE